MWKKIENMIKSRSCEKIENVKKSRNCEKIENVKKKSKLWKNRKYEKKVEVVNKNIRIVYKKSKMEKYRTNGKLEILKNRTLSIK